MIGKKSDPGSQACGVPLSLTELVNEKKPGNSGLRCPLSLDPESRDWEES